MNQKSCKRMRKHIRQILPDAPERVYERKENNQPGDKYLKMPSVILGMCQRKFYQQLKRDVKRFRAMNIMPKGVAAHA